MDKVPMSASHPGQIDICGNMNQAQAAAVAAKIRELRDAALPVTVHIRSGGGEVRAFHTIRRAIGTSLPHGQYKVVTVSQQASSAAAYVLVFGHDARVFRGASIGFHGVAWQLSGDRKHLRRESAMTIGMRLDRENRIVARHLARRVALRMASRYSLMENATLSSHLFSSLRPFVLWIMQRLVSAQMQDFLNRSFARFSLIYELASEYQQAGGLISSTGVAGGSSEALMLQSAIAHRCVTNSTARMLDPIVATEIVVDYILARDVSRGAHPVVLQQIRDLLLWKNETPPLSFINKHKNINLQRSHWLTTTSEQIWCFALVLCHSLLSSESVILPVDAYWLGLIDRVVDFHEGDCFK
jgi:ATP-dependent protease ClpP protease subunit